MKQLLLGTLICSLLFSLIGCKQYNKHESSERITTIDVTQKADEISIDLSDLSDNIKLVKLETNEESLIEYFYGIVGDKYIISINENNILQFSSDGSFIGTIAVRGGGPNEFNQLDAFVLDDKERFLMYHDISRSNIFKYNLDKREYEKPIPFELIDSFNGMVAINDTTLAILTGRFSKYPYRYFYLSHNGGLLGGLKKETIIPQGCWAGRTPIFMKAMDNSILLHPSETDTLFSVNKNEMKPLLSFTVEKPVKTGSKTVGYHLAFLTMNQSFVYLQKSGYESIITTHSSQINISDSQIIVFNKEDASVKKINQLTYQDIGITLNPYYLTFLKNNRFIIRYPAIEFKALLNKAIKDNSIGEEKLNNLKRLNDSITENDNPILITGTLKR